jgi:hypothetical protein
VISTSPVSVSGRRAHQGHPRSRSYRPRHHRRCVFPAGLHLIRLGASERRKLRPSTETQAIGTRNLAALMPGAPVRALPCRLPQAPAAQLGAEKRARLTAHSRSHSARLAASICLPRNSPALLTGMASLPERPTAAADCGVPILLASHVEMFSSFIPFCTPGREPIRSPQACRCFRPALSGSVLRPA